MKVIEIIIPVYNALEYTDMCIRSVFKYAVNNDKIRTNVTVIDDCSDDYVAKYLDTREEEYVNYKVLRNGENMGFVKTCNIAMRQTGADIVCLLNSDTVVTPHFVEKILNCFESDPQIGIASPISTSSPNMSIEILPGFNLLSMANLIDKCSDRRRPDIVTPEGFCYCIRKEVIIKQGLFDEIFGMGYGEESDYSMRALSNGFRTVCIDDLYIYHKRHATFTEPERQLRNKENRKIFDERWASLYKEKYTQTMNPNPIDYLRQRVARCRTKKHRYYYQKDRIPHFKPLLESLNYSYREYGLRKTLKNIAHYMSKILADIAHACKAISPWSSKSLIDNVGHIFEKPTNYRNDVDGLRITFVLRNICIAGGVISVINMANELILMGIEVSVVVTHPDKKITGIKMLFEPILLSSAVNVTRHMPQSDIYVATLWTTAFYVHKITKNNKSTACYFVQDYEVNFVQSKVMKAKVRKTYQILKNKFAKTKWLVEMMNSEGCQCHKINPAIDLNIFYPLKRKENSCVGILAMNRSSTVRRGSRILLESLKIVKERYPDVDIQLFGERAYDAGFDFEFLGRLSHSELADYYRKTDIYVDTSSFHGFGRPGVEALACGCALVSTDSGRVREYAIDGENCLLVRAGDSEDVAEKIMKLIKDQQLRETLRRNGIQTVQEYAEHIPARQFMDWTDLLIK